MLFYYINHFSEPWNWSNNSEVQSIYTLDIYLTAHADDVHM